MIFLETQLQRYSCNTLSPICIPFAHPVVILPSLCHNEKPSLLFSGKIIRNGIVQLMLATCSMADIVEHHLGDINYNSGANPIPYFPSTGMFVPGALTPAPFRTQQTLDGPMVSRKTNRPPSWTANNMNVQQGIVQQQNKRNLSFRGGSTFKYQGWTKHQPGWRSGNRRLPNSRFVKNSRNGLPKSQTLEEGEFRPPRLQDLRRVNKKRTRKFFPRNRPTYFQGPVPEAPRNTTSYIMRANKHGIESPLVSPAVLPSNLTPLLSPNPWKSGTAGEQLVEEARELHVDPYGSMNGCIRLQSPAIEESGESDISADKDEVSEMSDRTSSSNSAEPACNLLLPHTHDSSESEGLRKFELTYHADKPRGDTYLQARIEEQESQISHLEEENMTLRERLYLAEQELQELKRRAGMELDGEMEGEWSGEEASCAAGSPAGSVDACN